MKYIVTYVDKEGNFKPFYTNWFDSLNNFREDLNMIVYDLWADLYTTDGKMWLTIEEDHL